MTTPQEFPTQEQLKQIGELAAKEAFKKTRNLLETIVGDPHKKWMLQNQSAQVEYFAMQAVKFDLDGLAITSDGLTLFGAPIGRFNPLTPMIEKLSSKVWGKLLDKATGDITSKVVKFFAPASVNEAREQKAKWTAQNLRDERQDDRVTLFREEQANLNDVHTQRALVINERVSTLSGQVSRLAGIEAQEARRIASMNERRASLTSRQHGGRAEGDGLRAEAQHFDAVARSLRGVREEAARLAGQLG